MNQHLKESQTLVSLTTITRGRRRIHLLAHRNLLCDILRLPSSRRAALDLYAILTLLWARGANQPPYALLLAALHTALQETTMPHNVTNCQSQKLLRFYLLFAQCLCLSPLFPHPLCSSMHVISPHISSQLSHPPIPLWWPQIDLGDLDPTYKQLPRDQARIGCSSGCAVCGLRCVLIWIDMYWTGQLGLWVWWYETEQWQRERVHIDQCLKFYVCSNVPNSMHSYHLTALSDISNRIVGEEIATHCQLIRTIFLPM